MSVAEELRTWQAQQRAQARAKLLAEGMPAAAVDRLISEALGMHEAQADCAARMAGEAQPVELH